MRQVISEERVSSPAIIPSAVESNNPYLREFLALPESHRADGTAGEYLEEKVGADHLNCRKGLVTKYSWAVPNEAAIDAVRRHAPSVVEVGAGNGYWAHLLAQAGVDVVAYDVDPPSPQWFPVRRGATDAVAQHAERALLLCWPPRLTEMATQAVMAYAGETLIYVGEFMRGSADGWFFFDLWHNWREVERVAIPRWFNRLDDLRVFRRWRAAGSFSYSR